MVEMAELFLLHKFLLTRLKLLRMAMNIFSLSELPLPSWFIPSLSKIMYLFPKAHSLCYVRLALTFMWFKRNFPKEFNRIVLN